LKYKAKKKLCNIYHLSQFLNQLQFNKNLAANVEVNASRKIMTALKYVRNALKKYVRTASSFPHK